MPSPFIDITGERHGKLVALYRWPERISGHWKWLCRCDCGKELLVRQDTFRGQQKSCGCDKVYHPFPKGDLNPAWKGGVPTTTNSGYVRERSEYQHIRTAEMALGRRLPAGAQVHHVDEDRSNNAAANLVICQDQKYHKLLHTRMRVQAVGGNPDTDKICSSCKGCFARTVFFKDRSRPDGLEARCPECFSKRRKVA